MVKKHYTVYDLELKLHKSEVRLKGKSALSKDCQYLKTHHTDSQHTYTKHCISIYHATTVQAS